MDAPSLPADDRKSPAAALSARLRFVDLPELLLVVLGAAAIVALLAYEGNRRDGGAAAASVEAAYGLLRAERQDLERLAALHARLGTVRTLPDDALRATLAEVEDIRRIHTVQADGALTPPPAAGEDRSFAAALPVLAERARADRAPVSAFVPGAPGTGAPWLFAAAPLADD